MSSVVSPELKAPVTEPTSSVAAENTAVGPAVSITTDCAVDASETLPAGSVLLAVILWVASANVDVVILQILSATVAVPIESDPE